MSQREPRTTRKDLILLVEDSRTQALRTRLTLEAHGFDVEVCTTGAMALARAAELEPDLILLDMHLPDMNGREVAQWFKADNYLAGIPIVFITEVFRDVADIIDGFADGVDDYLIKPVADGELVARLRASLRAKRTQRELGRLARLLKTVNEVGLQLAGILNQDTLLHSVARLVRENFSYPRVHLFLAVDGELVLAAADGVIEPDPSGGAASMAAPFRLPLDGNSRAALAAANDQAEASEEPSGHPLLPGWSSGLALPVHSAGKVSGVLEIVSPTPVVFSEMDRVGLQTLADMVGIAVQNARLYRQMEEFAHRDGLTNLLNRRAILEGFERACAETVRDHGSLSVALIDADRFKQVNDRYGHASGDLVIQQLAEIFRSGVREADLIGRIGGDEFLVVMPGAHLATAQSTAQRLQTAVSARPFRIDRESTISCSVSIGVTSWPGTQVDSPGGLIAAADDELYRCKAAGGNGVSA